MQIFAQQALNGLTYAGLLFLLGSGFTLIFGLMRIVNLAHGGIYLLGGYVGTSAIAVTHNVFIGLVAAALAMAVFGLLLERGLLARVRNRPMSELLLTMGVAFIIGDIALAVWGGDTKSIRLPAPFDASSSLGPLTYPNGRLLILGVAVVVAIALWLVLGRTRIGAMVRAGVDDREMASALGIDINFVFSAVFVGGSALAGAAGVLGGSLLALYPGADSDIMTLALVVVIIGGLGTLKGAVVGSVVVGLIDNFGKAYVPELAYFSVFVPMVLVLLWRPEGLFGRRATP